MQYSREELMEKAGPREMLFFAPEKVHAAIVTCGGLCPGLNSVIRAIVMTLWYQYGCRQISGIRYGYQGFLNDGTIDSIQLNPDVVDSSTVVEERFSALHAAMVKKQLRLLTQS